MSLLPEEIASKSFRRRWRGYDRHQVDVFLQRITADYTAAIHRIAAVAEDRSWNDRGAEQTRREAGDDADAIRARAEQAAALLVRNAEETAAALTGQAERLRGAARHDAEDAQAQLARARQRAAELEIEARRQCAAQRAEADQHQERLRAAERTVTDRLRAIDHAAAALRSRVGVLDQVRLLEELIDTIRAEVTQSSPHLRVAASSPAAENG